MASAIAAGRIPARRPRARRGGGPAGVLVGGGRRPAGAPAQSPSAGPSGSAPAGHGRAGVAEAHDEGRGRRSQPERRPARSATTAVVVVRDLSGRRRHPGSRRAADQAHQPGRARRTRACQVRHQLAPVSPRRGPLARSSKRARARRPPTAEVAPASRCRCPDERPGGGAADLCVTNAATDGSASAAGFARRRLNRRAASRERPARPRWTASGPSAGAEQAQLGRAREAGGGVHRRTGDLGGGPVTWLTASATSRSP